MKNKQFNPTSKAIELFQQDLQTVGMPKVLGYLHPNEINNLCKANFSLFKQLRDSSALEYRKQKNYCDLFRRLVAVEGEDNQNQAQIMLQQYPDLVAELITSRGKMRDAAGREFLEPMSAYGYAYWAGDTFMRHMMEQCIDKDAKTKAWEECLHIEEYGVTFLLYAQKTIHSRHFDFQPLILAYQTFLQQSTLLENMNNWSNSALRQAEFLWLRIGQEQAKLPTHIAQEFCSNRKFHPLPDFSQENLNRTIRFHDYKTNNNECFLGSNDANASLKRSFTLYKGIYSIPVKQAALSLATSAIRHDLAAVTALYQQRIEIEPRETFSNLKSAENGDHLTQSSSHR